MNARIIKIGNSKGIIIPKEFLKLLHFKENVELAIIEEKLVIQSAKKKPRHNWELAIEREIEKNGPAEQLIPDVFEDESFEDWTW